jgi:hypothetical protein
MIEIVWEFLVQEEARGQFELAFGPGGVWSKLFGRCPGFRGTTVLRDTNNPQRYLMVDLWDNAAQREQALVDHQAAYLELEAVFAEWTESKTEVGTFSVRAEATVRPRGGARRMKASRGR